jgi:hypothetical protein
MKDKFWTIPPPANKNFNERQVRTTCRQVIDEYKLQEPENASVMTRRQWEEESEEWRRTKNCTLCLHRLTHDVYADLYAAINFHHLLYTKYVEREQHQLTLKLTVRGG